MTKYVLSRYTYIHEYSEGYLIFNTVNGHFGYIYATKMKKIIERLIVKECILDNELTKSLIINGFVVPENTDEITNVINNYKEITNSKSLHLIILPTMGCNFSCLYCYEKHDSIVMSNKTWDNLKNAIVKYVSENEPNYISLGWFGGEPLLELTHIKSFYEWFDVFCSKNNIEYSSEMTTNGYLINEEMITFFNEFHINNFQITIDGMPYTHDKLRYLVNGNGTWDRITKNLLMMKNACIKSLNVTLRINFSVDTITSVLEFFDYILENYDERFSVSLNAISRLGGVNDNKLMKMSPEVISYTDLQLIKHLNSKKIDAGAMFSLFNPFGMICYAGKANNLVINPHGKILKCTVELENDINIVGNIDDGFFNLDVEKMKRWTYVDFEILKKRRCVDCVFFPLCMSRCCGFANVKGIKRCPIQIALIDNYLEQYYEYIKNLER